MRRFELVEGASSKFWEVALSGCDVTVRFGRIGTNGQTKTKSLASEAAAQKEYDALLKEKTAKGYAEVGVAAGASLAAVSAPPPAAKAAAQVAAPSPIAAPVAAIAPPAQEAPNATAPSQAPTIDWPGMQWTPALRAALPSVRGIHAPPPIADPALLERPVVFGPYWHGPDKFLAAAQRYGRAWQPWHTTMFAARIAPDALRQADLESWLELAVQAAHASYGAAPDDPLRGPSGDGMFWVLRVGLALRGLPFVVSLTLALLRGEASPYHWMQCGLHDRLALIRRAIAVCDDTEHDAVIDLLEREVTTPLERLLRALLCPHREDWCLAALAEAQPQGGKDLLEQCVAPAAVMREIMRSAYPVYGQREGALLLQLALHGAEALPLLAQLTRESQDYMGRDKFIALVGRVRVPAAIDLLAELREHTEARTQLETLAERHPEAVLERVFARTMPAYGSVVEGWLRRLALSHGEALAAVLPRLGEAARTRAAAWLENAPSAEATPEQLPALLREPPWLRKARAVALPTLEPAVRALPDRMVWPAGAKERAAGHQIESWRYRSNVDPIDSVMADLRIAAAARPRLLAGQPLQAGDIGSGYGGSPETVLMLSDAAGLALWNSYPAKLWYDWNGIEGPIHAVLARHGEAAVPGLVAYAQAFPDLGLASALPVASAALVPVALHALHKLKKAKPPAIAWLRAHADTALVGALPLAFGADKAQRDAAQAGLRWFLGNGFEAQARAAAASYGAPMEAALQALLDADPLLVLPARIPKLPAFFVPAAFRRPQLRDGGAALPVAAAEHLGAMLAISKLEAPYAGLAVVKELCTPASLAAFAWDLFEAWLAADAPSKEGWAFAALGLLGDDDTARRLTPRIREWPTEGAIHRATTGLDLLAAIGSDVALMHLNAIASKVKSKPLQERAKEKIATVADVRGFTAAELADRLVPDLGLDERGTLTLDFGARRFTVAFDETLKPLVRDEQGVRLKDLPKPLKSDDAALAEAATERWKQLRKDAKAIASLQLLRLEMAMVERRRWSGVDFRLLFLEHPLMRHLAARLVWGLCDEAGAVVGAFRIAEDWTLADADDMQLALPDDARIGLAHVLEMPATLRDAFGQLFADYAILQPFRQLGRETFALTEAERAATEIRRFEAKTVATGSIMGLVNRGWDRGETQQRGSVGWFSKRVGDDLQIDIELDPGLSLGDVTFLPRQRIPRIVLRRVGTWNDNGLHRFDKLDPIIASEMLRDAELLAPLADGTP